MRDSRVLIVPVEVKAREFYSRLYFAAKAARRGYKVLLGRSANLHSGLRRFPRSIIVENDVTPKGYRFIARARSLGYGVVAWDEEAIVTLSDEIYAEYRVSGRTLGRVSLFFTRGRGDAAAIAARYPDLGAKVRPAGNPRFDILRPSLFSHQTAWSPEHRAVILFNSRFATVNPFAPAPLERRRHNRLAKYNLLGSQTLAARAMERWFDHQKVALQHCLKLVGALAKAFPDKTVVVRPHPSEGRKVWEEVAREHCNCVVQQGGSAIEDILKADVLVHNSCTTAIEANLLGVPTVSFVPNYDEMCDNYLTNLIGQNCHTIASAIEAVRATELGGIDDIAARSTAARERYGAFIAGLDGTDSSDTILNEIDGLSVEAEPLRWRLGVLSSAWMMQVKHSAKQLLGFSKSDPQRWAVKEDYHKQKFSGLNEQEISGALTRFGLGAHSVQRFADQWFHISA